MMNNVGPIDCLIRFMIGLILISMIFLGPKTPWGWIGLIPLASSFLGYCPLYTALGFDSNRTKK